MGSFMPKEESRRDAQITKYREWRGKFMRTFSFSTMITFRTSLEVDCHYYSYYDFSPAKRKTYRCNIPDLFRIRYLLLRKVNEDGNEEETDIFAPHWVTQTLGQVSADVLKHVTESWRNNAPESVPSLLISSLASLPDNVSCTLPADQAPSS